jgi:hypothetical protein
MTEKEKRGFVGDLYWHVHHERLAEFLTEPIANRIRYIKSAKPKGEVATRLKWMTPVLDPPAPLMKAWVAYAKAQAAYNKAWATYDKARVVYDKTQAVYDKADAAYNKALAAYNKAWVLKRLHAAEHPGCPWDGKTIFPVKP